MNIKHVSFSDSRGYVTTLSLTTRLQYLAQRPLYPWYVRLLAYILGPISSGIKLSRLFSSSSGQSVTVPEVQIPKGLYLYGDVGTGKTMLMDLFYNTLPDGIKRKRRVHFHSFMIDVHKRIHEAKKQLGLDGGDPIAPVARDLASEAYVLCFDEFQVR